MEFTGTIEGDGRDGYSATVEVTDGDYSAKRSAYDSTQAGAAILALEDAFRSIAGDRSVRES
jgi:hypothetical protein